MRLNLFILLFTIGCLGWGPVAAQSNKISVAPGMQTIEELIAIIEENSDYIFFYNTDVLDLSEKINVSKSEYTIEQLLRLITQKKDIKCYIVGRQIVLYKRSIIKSDTTSIYKMAIRGMITDRMGNPVVGANIVEKGTTNGVSSDKDGNFQIVTSLPGTLKISYVGFVTQEVFVESDKQYQICLQENSYLLDELVVIGYGTLQRKQVTSAITSLSGEDILKGTASSTVAASLIGKINGLILHETSSVNAGATLQLRGMGSINASREPLVVVDGMPGADIRSVLPEDIEMIDVLKDASAGAIYGSRASSGVLLITTKTSNITNGTVKFNYSSEAVWKHPTNKPRVLTAGEYVKFNRGMNYGSDVDWWDESMNTKKWSQRHVFSLQSGVRNSQIYASLSYEDMQGLKKFEESSRYSGRINANFKLLDDWLEVKAHADYRQNRRKGFGGDYTPNLQQALSNNPTRSPYDAHSQTGYNIWLNETLDYNSIANAATSESTGLDKWFKPDVTLRLNILSVPGLSLQQTVAYENRQWEQQVWKSRYNQTQLEYGYTGWASLLFNKSEFITSEGFLSYQNVWHGHTLNTVAGYSYWEKNQEEFGMANGNFTNDLVKHWDIGEGKELKAGEATLYSGKTITEKLLAYFARVNYAYEDKYMLMGTYRREGSSKFAENNRWGNFWSLSAGWRLSKEPFMADYYWMNDLKLRMGYGVVGNNGFDADYAATMYSSDMQWLMPNGSWSYSYGKARAVNKNLKWEEQREWNLGVDYSFFNNRFYGKLDLYLRKNHGLIFEVQIPQPPYVHQTMFKNVGVLLKKGWEFELGYNPIVTKDWSYSTLFGISHLTQQVKSLWGDQSYFEDAYFPTPGSPGNAMRIEEGVRIGQFHLWKFAGFDENGNWLLYNKKGEVIPATQKKYEDKQHIGNYYPRFTLNWNHTLTYKNFDLSLTLLSYIDFDIYNAIDMYYGIASVSSNQNVLHKAYTKYAHIKGEKELCDFFLQDGTFLKIQNLYLGYTYNLKKHSRLLDKVRFYLSVNNLYTFTRYSGSDPSTVNITGLNQGIDWHTDIHPMARTFTFGVNLTL
ncbi:TonB-linked SusC/RagA family outer membrane protein [Parabacteroides sp. PM5-20]|uniref:SusC/RagA family TonB-linked outer membrane protein n=1 Tax=Parabacteroides sp. 52 TaxID=2302940 RepID=UPI001EF1B607|nr:SusC/RagA family TonB-linked outer membrane protein [Parabacteroides sp. 52]MDH6535040.1 TonB-linked SusC/RagA family outer membrane protein [Parabacteroides sp. PM5-20]